MNSKGRFSLLPRFPVRKASVAKRARSVVLMSPLDEVKAAAVASMASEGGSSAMKRMQSFWAMYFAVDG